MHNCNWIKENSKGKEVEVRPKLVCSPPLLLRVACTPPKMTSNPLSPPTITKAKLCPASGGSGSTHNKINYSVIGTRKYTIGT